MTDSKTMPPEVPGASILRIYVNPEGLEMALAAGFRRDEIGVVEARVTPTAVPCPDAVVAAAPHAQRSVIDPRRPFMLRSVTSVF